MRSKDNKRHNVVIEDYTIGTYSFKYSDEPIYRRILIKLSKIDYRMLKIAGVYPTDERLKLLIRSRYFDKYYTFKNKIKKGFIGKSYRRSSAAFKSVKSAIENVVEYLLPESSRKPNKDKDEKKSNKESYMRSKYTPSAQESAEDIRNNLWFSPEKYHETITSADGTNMHLYSPLSSHARVVQESIKSSYRSKFGKSEDSKVLGIITSSAFWVYSPYEVVYVGKRPVTRTNLSDPNEVNSMSVPLYSTNGESTSVDIDEQKRHTTWFKESYKDTPPWVSKNPFPSEFESFHKEDDKPEKVDEREEKQKTENARIFHHTSDEELVDINLKDFYKGDD